jgi:hypothetical protein
MCLHLLWHALQLLCMDFHPCLYIYIYTHTHGCLLASLTMLLVMFPKFQMGVEIDLPKVLRYITLDLSFDGWQLRKRTWSPLFFFWPTCYKVQRVLGVDMNSKSRLQSCFWKNWKSEWLSEGVKTNFCARLRFSGSKVSYDIQSIKYLQSISPMHVNGKSHPAIAQHHDWAYLIK